MILLVCSKEVAVQASLQCYRLTGEYGEVVRGHRHKGQDTPYYCLAGHLTEDQAALILDAIPPAQVVSFAGCLSCRLRKDVASGKSEQKWPPESLERIEEVYCDDEDAFGVEESWGSVLALPSGQPYREYA